MTQERPIKKDWFLRLLAVGSYFIALYFSFVSEAVRYDVLSFLWAMGSVIYWVIVNEFEKRDREWTVQE